MQLALACPLHHNASLVQFYIHCFRTDTIENVAGKPYLNVINTLDEEIEVQVPILRLKLLNELFDNHVLNIKTSKTIEQKLRIYRSILRTRITKSVMKYSTAVQI